MQCKLRFPLLQHMISISWYTQHVPRPGPSPPRRFWPLPRPAPHCGEGGVPRPALPHRILALPLPAQWKNSFPCLLSIAYTISGNATSGMVWECLWLSILYSIHNSIFHGVSSSFCFVYWLSCQQASQFKVAKSDFKLLDQSFQTKVAMSYNLDWCFSRPKLILFNCIRLFC